ncbi:MAG: UPF0280 family protein [Thermoplasmatales archaeon]|nr:UPF0280 family protein [Thermoplasmatales archaeon]
MILRRRLDVGDTHIEALLSEDVFHAVSEAVFEAREEIEGRIAEDPFFGITYEPVEPSPNDPRAVRDMCAASVAAGVGPMAAVAGAIANAAVLAAVREGCRFAVIDNGGDIAYVADRHFTVGIHAGDSRFPGMALSVPPSTEIRSICSSSGSIGHSVSLGGSRISTVISKDPALADAFATALGNVSVSEDRESLSAAVEGISGRDGVEGCFTIFGDLFVSAGEIPEIVEVDSTDVRCCCQNRFRVRF